MTGSKKTFLTAALSIAVAASLLLSSCVNDAEPNQPGSDQDSEVNVLSRAAEYDQPEADDSNELVEESDQQPELPVIGLYTGKGSWDINIEAFKNFFDHYGIKWSEFDEQDAVSLDLYTYYDIIWFPGGFAAEYKNLIPEHTNIRTFVEEGGAFIGSCAGAYYAGDILRWHGTDHEYSLKLFEGRGIGPLAGQIAWGERGSFYLEKNQPANDSFDETLEMYYFDGPYFEAYDPGSIEILARYTVNDQPAVIAGRYHSGKYLLLGPHPEIGSYLAETAGYNLEGGEGAQWPWLYAALLWFSDW